MVGKKMKQNRTLILILELFRTRKTGFDLLYVGDEFGRPTGEVRGTVTTALWRIE